MSATTVQAATLGGEGGHDAIADYLRKHNLIAVSNDALARACNLANVGYTDFLKIKAYLPPLPGTTPPDLTTSHAPQPELTQ